MIQLSALRRLARDTSGLGAIEFAFSLPVILTTTIYGVELSNLALANLKLSQVAITLADNASRVGVRSNLSVQQLREGDINDVLTGARMQGSNIKLTDNGRITVSSIQVNKDGGQWIAWQRCLGVKSGAAWDSSYGVQNEGATGTSFAGMGKSGEEVTAPPNSAVIFVEVKYDYKPVINFGLNTAKQLSYTSSFVVRDRRDLTQVYNPTPAATPMTCDKYTSSVPRRG